MNHPFGPLVDHYERCFSRFGDTPQGVDWPNAVDAETRYGVMADVVEPGFETGELLDVGCGAGHFLEYLRRCPGPVPTYRGLDQSPVFIGHCRQKFTGVDFQCLDLLNEASRPPQADYVVMNGVFTEKLSANHDAFFDAVKSLLVTVFGLARRGIAFNLMSKHVDWERDDLFHVAYDDIARFVISNLSRHHVIRADYGLYEYTVYVYKFPQTCNGRKPS